MVIIVFMLAFLVLIVGVIIGDFNSDDKALIIGSLISFLLVVWATISCCTDYTKEETKQFLVHIVENNAIIIDGRIPVNVNDLKQFEDGDIVIKRTVGGEYLFGIYWEPISTYECCVGDPVEGNN